MKHLSGQLVALTRNVWLVPPPIGPGYRASFSAGKPGGYSSTNFGLTWWYTTQSFAALRRAAAIIADSGAFPGCDSESAEHIIRGALEELCVDRSLFALHEHTVATHPTLLDRRRSPDVAAFGDDLASRVLQNVKDHLSQWCILYAAPRINGECISIDGMGIHAIPRQDSASWDRFLEKGYFTRGWRPCTGAFDDGQKTVFASLKYDYVFLAEAYGTQRTGHFEGQLKLRLFLSAVFAAIRERTPHGLDKSAADSYRVCIQFPGPSKPSLHMSLTTLEPLLPYYIDDWLILSEDVVRIQAWFACLSALAEEDRNRVMKCAHFINRAMNSNDIEAFVNYFVSLDALFGRRGSVEDSIRAGVAGLKLDRRLEETFRWLLDLRNELVHGGSRHIGEWPKHQRYCRHFDSTPSRDIERLALFALSRAPRLMA